MLPNIKHSVKILTEVYLKPDKDVTIHIPSNDVPGRDTCMASKLMKSRELISITLGEGGYSGGVPTGLTAMVMLSLQLQSKTQIRISFMFAPHTWYTPHIKLSISLVH